MHKAKICNSRNFKVYLSSMQLILLMGFSGISAGKESTLNAADPSFIPVSGRSLGEGIDYLCQYSWASLVAQGLKKLPAMQET